MLHCVTQYRLFHNVVCFQNVALFRGTRVAVTVRFHQKLKITLGQSVQPW